MSTSDTEPESDAEASDSAMARLADSMREAGPAGYLFAAAVLIAAVVVVWSLSASDVVSTAVPEGEITEEAPSPPDLTGPESEQRSSEQPGSGTRDDIRALNQCFREHGIASRVTSATETELVLGVRPGSDPDTILEQPGLQDCIDEHLGGFDLEVSATEIAQGRSTEDGGSSDDRGDDDGADIQRQTVPPHQRNRLPTRPFHRRDATTLLQSVDLIAVTNPGVDPAGHIDHIGHIGLTPEGLRDPL